MGLRASLKTKCIPREVGGRGRQGVTKKKSTARLSKVFSIKKFKISVHKYKKKIFLHRIGKREEFLYNCLIIKTNVSN